MTLRLVLASANPDKVNEIEIILGSAVRGIELLPRPAHVGDVVEDADTLEGNARLKAVALCRATGLPAVADDTGLEVDALGGAPGVRSARYAGDDAVAAHNIVKLLDALADVEPARRTARFRTVALVCWPGRSELAAEGTVEGVIAHEPHGVGGFGYDPVFVPTGPGTDGRTFAQMRAEEKHAVSHRGRAFRSLAALLAGRS